MEQRKRVDIFFVAGGKQTLQMTSEVAQSLATKFRIYDRDTDSRGVCEFECELIDITRNGTGKATLVLSQIAMVFIS